MFKRAMGFALLNHWIWGYPIGQSQVTGAAVLTQLRFHARHLPQKWRFLPIKIWDNYLKSGQEKTETDWIEIPLQYICCLIPLKYKREMSFEVVCWMLWRSGIWYYIQCQHRRSHASITAEVATAKPTSTSAQQRNYTTPLASLARPTVSLNVWPRFHNWQLSESQEQWI